MRKRIALVMQLFREAGKAVCAMPALLFQPIYVSTFQSSYTRAVFHFAKEKNVNAKSYFPDVFADRPHDDRVDLFNAVDRERR